ncbi:LOW QUALITY PROTEIN: hypothetical protein HID58_056808 [Brassica napus]|uniref:Uncharacterized protein n=1 Tax=Brassica napus TaxID=3708 RepID=A0ABQ8AP93_BRANA|nr:LOW QUALITY PROTEIN: hypothetical protein HID58_056808 [Brassica napus]
MNILFGFRLEDFLTKRPKPNYIKRPRRPKIQTPQPNHPPIHRATPEHLDSSPSSPRPPNLPGPPNLGEDQSHGSVRASMLRKLNRRHIAKEASTTRELYRRCKSSSTTRIKTPLKWRSDYPISSLLAANPEEEDLQRTGLPETKP